MTDDFVTLTIERQKNIALIAHDSKKAEMIEWCNDNKDILKNHFLCGTGTTARMIADNDKIQRNERNGCEWPHNTTR